MWFIPVIPSLELASHVVQCLCLVPGFGIGTIWMREYHVEGFSCADGVGHHMSLVADPSYR